MRRARAVLLATLLTCCLTACGIGSTDVARGGRAPTGVARGVTLYFVDEHGALHPQLRRVGHLGNISEAMALLLAGPGGGTLHTEIESAASASVSVTTEPGRIRLRVPLSRDEVTAVGIDQIVCTALGVYVQSGGAPDATVRVQFTLATREQSMKWRRCPVLRPGR